MLKIVIISGLGDSSESHWQTYWLKKFTNATKVLQDDWDAPKLNNWLKNLNNTLVDIDGPIILVAHSLGNSLVAHWAANYNSVKIKGALLVAPADVDSPIHTPDIIRGFAPIPLLKLPFPSIVVASENDPFVDINRAKYFAENWGSDFVNVQKKGHINGDTNLKFWEEGQLLLRKLASEKF